MASDEANRTERTATARSAAPLALAWIEPGGTLGHCNRPWRELLGPPAGQPAPTLLALVDRDDRPALVAAIERARAGASARVEVRCTRAGGVTLHLEWEITAEHDSNGLFCCARELAQQRAHEARGRVDLSLLRALSESAPFGLYMVYRGSDTVAYANAQVGELLEIPDLAARARAGTITRSEVQRQLATLIDADAISPEALAIIRGAPQDVRTECDAIYRDGRTVRLLVTPMLDDAGDPVGALYIAEDVTDRTRAEHAVRVALERLERSEAEFRRLIEHVPDGIVVMREGMFVYANPAAAQILGYDAAKDLVGVHFAAIVRPEELPQSTERVRKMLGDAPPPRALRPMVRRDGTTVYAETLGFQIEFDGAPATLVIAHDVTAERRIQARIRQAERLASVGTLAAGVAHEINNPLAYILLNLGQIHRHLRDQRAAGSTPALETLASLVDQSREGAERVRDIVRDLRTFSRLDDERSALVDVREVLDSTLQMAQHEIVRRARLVRDYHQVPPVRANESRLAQVFLNLIVNAAQAISDGDRDSNEIRVTVRTGEDGRVVVSVTDSGVGMARDVRERVFDPFFTTKAVGEGTGLGLSVCLGIVQGLGGEIGVESSLGHGSTFCVKLPPADRSPLEPPRQSPRAVIPRARILVVDDEVRIAAAFTEALAGHEVVTAHDGGRALELLRGGRFDVIFCDLSMAGITGMDVFERACREDPALAPRFVFMTAGAYTPRARAFLDHVANPRLDKPFDWSEVEQLLALVLSANPRQEPG